MKSVKNLEKLSTKLFSEKVNKMTANNVMGGTATGGSGSSIALKDDQISGITLN
jgi:hypothetical protein